jgi:hypothetical protein
LLLSPETSWADSRYAAVAKLDADVILLDGLLA